MNLGMICYANNKETVNVIILNHTDHEERPQLCEADLSPISPRFSVNSSNEKEEFKSREVLKERLNTEMSAKQQQKPFDKFRKR